VRDGVLITPPRTAVLEGITRDSLMTLAGEIGIRVEEQLVARDQLYAADEVFLCGTAAEVVPVREIDFRIIGNGGKGPITAALQKAFFDAVAGRGSHPEWLDLVDETIVGM